MMRSDGWTAFHETLFSSDLLSSYGSRPLTPIGPRVALYYGWDVARVQNLGLVDPLGEDEDEMLRAGDEIWAELRAGPTLVFETPALEVDLGWTLIGNAGRHQGGTWGYSWRSLLLRVDSRAGELMVTASPWDTGLPSHASLLVDPGWVMVQSRASMVELPTDDGRSIGDLVSEASVLLRFGRISPWGLYGGLGLRQGWIADDRAPVEHWDDRSEIRSRNELHAGLHFPTVGLGPWGVDSLELVTIEAPSGARLFGGGVNRFEDVDAQGLMTLRGGLWFAAGGGELEGSLAIQGRVAGLERHGLVVAQTEPGRGRQRDEDGADEARVENPLLDFQAGIKNPMGLYVTGGLFDIGARFAVPRWAVSPTAGASLSWSGMSGTGSQEREEWWDEYGWPILETRWGYTDLELDLEPGLRLLTRWGSLGVGVSARWMRQHERWHVDGEPYGVWESDPGEHDLPVVEGWRFPGAIHGRIVTPRLLADGVWGLVPEGTSHLLLGYRTHLGTPRDGWWNRSSLLVKSETWWLDQAGMGRGATGQGVLPTMTDVDAYLPYVYLGLNLFHFGNIDLPKDLPDYDLAYPYLRLGPSAQRCMLANIVGQAGHATVYGSTLYTDKLCSFGVVAPLRADAIGRAWGFYTTGPFPWVPALENGSWLHSSWEATMVAGGGVFLFFLRFNVRYY